MFWLTFRIIWILNVSRVGNNFRQVFSHWAAAAGVEERIFYDHWRLDDAYRQHEIGAIDFHRYTQHMTEQLGVELSQEAWRVGWNALWTEPHHRTPTSLWPLWPPFFPPATVAVVPSRFTLHGRPAGRFAFYVLDLS